MVESIAAQISSLQRMTAAQLRERWREVFGNEPGTRTKTEMWQTLAREIQDHAHGRQADDYRIRDSRLPMPGAIITRRYKGHEIIVKVLEDGLEYQGRAYQSLTAIADEVTGSHWNGYLFFGLTKQKRKQR